MCSSSREVGARPCLRSHARASSRSFSRTCTVRVEYASICACVTPRISLPRPSARGIHATPNSRVSSHSTVGGGDRLQRAEDRAHAHGVQGTPFPVAEGPGDPRDLVVNVILGIAVPAGALQPRGDDQPGGLEPARLAAVDPGAVVAGAGDPGPGLQVLQRGPVGPVQDLLERLLPPGPVRSGLLVAGQAGAALVLPQGGVQHRDGLGERDRDVVVGGGLAGGLGGLAFELDEPFGGGVRLAAWSRARWSAKVG